ncbi:VWA domain-containing protein [Parahaliea maris]|uniref:VWA domain-containing protein n=1 Tax=Parahaliea maris TaxID=2716870 RepID=A0A5C9A046_9GAMM|nr:vWA domain-containing protein [Parahaliea maris]TXS92967.1 VWA domain-containing protein [Parahaliea maris]
MRFIPDLPRTLRGLLLPLVMLLPLLVQADPSARALKPDLRLLIDISGSMKESDPDNLRAPALELIVRLLPDGARAGVWTFGETVEVLVPHGEVDSNWREQARAAVAAIDNSGQRTNIPAALAAATYDIGSMDPSYRSSIVLLTDGKVDVSTSPMANAAAARKVLAETAPRLGATGIPVHTIALSDEADWHFLSSLAEESRGLAEKARTADALSGIFVQSLEMVAPAAQVPLKGGRFEIDDSVEEFTALLFYGAMQPALSLRGPDGAIYLPGRDAGADWFVADRFALVTVRSPAPGVWTLEAPGDARVRVTVIADLNLEVDPLPNSMPAGRVSELGLRLRDGDAVIRDPELLRLFNISIDISGPRNYRQHIDVSGSYPLPENGEYRVTIPALDYGGRYQLLARVSGQTLQRELPMHVEVHAGPSEDAISSRPAELPDASLQGPLLTLVGVLVFVALLAWWISRRRRRRRLALWERRFRDASAGEGEPVLQGLRADADALPDTLSDTLPDNLPDQRDQR